MFLTPGESLAPWVLRIEQESDMPLRPYLGRITSGKPVGAQNEKRPKIGTCKITLKSVNNE